MSEWINIQDRLPKLHDEVLLYMPSLDDSFESNYVVGYLESDFCFYFNNYGENIEAVNIEFMSHWMPLPKSPNEENE